MQPVKIWTAEPKDKAAIAALAAKIWQGEDYLAHHFDEWVGQRFGRFLVAYADDRLVGCGKLTRFGPGEWWLEGLRVDPDWRGKGIARLMHDHIVEVAEEIATAEPAGSYLRLATDGANAPVHKLSLDSGFIQTSKHLLYKAELAANEPTVASTFTAVQSTEKEQVESWFNQSTYFAGCHGLLEDNWKWYEIRPRLDKLLENGRLFWWQKSNLPTNPAAGLVIVHHRDETTLVLNYLDTPNGDWAALLDDVCQLGQQFGVGLIKSKPLATAEIKDAFLRSCWVIDYDLEMWVFERPLR